MTSSTTVVLTYLAQHHERHLDELFEFLRIPSISALTEHRADVARCAEHVAHQLHAIGLTRAEALPTDGHPVVYGEWTGALGQPTALIYGHYDVQPVDPLDLWESPPFQPTIRDGQVYARGATDDKGQVFMHLKALEAHLRTTGRLPINVKLLIEGEEEIGSANLDAFIAAHRDQLAADVAVISDTAMFARGVPSICYGLRGLAYLQLDVVGPASDLHSGSFGGALANPIEDLCKILAALKDENRRITIPGFYDDVRPLAEAERVELGLLPFDEEAFRRKVGVPALAGEAGYTTLERLWARPTLEINGMWGGFTGEGSKTVLPARASAKVSCRLVPDQDPERIADLLTEHVQRLCPPTISLTVTRMHGGKPCLTPLDHPAVQAAARAIEVGFGKRPVFTREGGTIPVVATLAEQLGLPSVLMGIGLRDENTHAPNEHLDLENLRNGMRSAAQLWFELAR
ncbi:MAG: dipeptidase [Chloroflexi bacterium]|nr:dipeptidase [Chloroflexota bacterium]